MRLNSTASPELPRPADERVAAPPYQLGEFHRFEGGGREYLYLVPSGAIFEPTRVASEILQLLRNGERTKEQLLPAVTNQGCLASEVEKAIEELHQSHAIVAGNGLQEPLQEAPLPFPLQTLVLNVTNQCNLSCKYCYEFGEDRVATPEGKPKFMSKETARVAVDYWLFRIFSGSRGQLQAAAVEVDGGNEVLLVAKAARRVLHPSNLRIQRFADGVGNAVFQ